MALNSNGSMQWFLELIEELGIEGLLDQLSCIRIQHRDRPLSSVQITTYNSNLGLLRSELCTLDTAQGRKTLGRKSRRAEINEVNVLSYALPDVERFS